jgi:Uma2 family endonuclease
MALKAKKQKYYTPEEYLALEESAEFRSEFDDGEIVAMAGGSLNHQQITANFARILGTKVRGKNCRVLPSEMKVWVETYQKFYYPDVTVVCDKPKFHKQRNDTIENPKLLIEVLSDSTESKDRGEKFLSYQSLESLQEYILISQDKYLVERYFKREDTNWIYQPTIGIESEVYFESVEETLKLSEIYDLVEIE